LIFPKTRDRYRKFDFSKLPALQLIDLRKRSVKTFRASIPKELLLSGPNRDLKADPHFREHLSISNATERFSPSMYRLNPARARIRKVSCLLLGPFLCLTAAVLLVSQFSELDSRNEILSLTSFLVLLSFSALAFNWCRVPTSACSERDLVAVYEVGVDLFLSSMMALLATFFSWLPSGASGIPSTLNPVLFILHLVFLLGALVLFLVAIFALLRVIRRGQGMERSLQ